MNLAKMYKTKLSERFVIAIWIALNLWICNVHAQDCKPQDFNIGSVSLELTPGVEVSTDDPLEIKMQLTTAVISHTENPSSIQKYLDISYDDINSRVLVTTTAHFLTYEKDQTNTELVASVVLNCADTRNIVMVVTFVLKDVNNYTPEFSKPSYEIEIPLPLPINFNIFWLITDTISATDYDLQNNQITFTSDITDQPFIVGTLSETETKIKEYFATIITTEKILNIQNGIEFTITATDSGIVPKSSTANVKIIAELDDDEPIVVPIFKESLYIGSLDFQQTPPTLTVAIISLVTETFIPLINFDIELADGDFFQLDRNNDDNAVQVILKNTVTEDDLIGKTQLSFVVKATRPDGISGNTVVLINIIPKATLEFDKVLYKGTIKSDRTIDHDLIKLSDATNQPDVVYSIKNTDVHFDWFNVATTVDGMDIQLKGSITETELEAETTILLTILAQSTGNTANEGESHIILVIERDDVVVPAFEKNFYEGSISTDLQIKDLEELKLKDPSIGNIIYEIIEHADLFEPSKTADGVEIKPKLLTSGDVADISSLQFTVTATNDKGISGSTVVILTIEHVAVVLPEFQKQIYTGSLERPISPATFQLENVLIQPHGGNIQYDLTGDDKIFFNIKEQLTNGISLELVDGISIVDRTILTVIVTATLVGETAKASTVVIINVEQEEVIQPTFDKMFYYGSLSETNTLTMIDTPIKLKDGTFVNTIQFTKTGDDSKYFTVQQTGQDNNLEIAVDPGANLNELADRTTLTFSIVATLNGNPTLTGTTTVVVELPIKVVVPDENPVFEKNLYVGSLTSDFKVNMESISLETFTAGTQFTLDGYDNNFFVIDDSTTSPGTINIVTNLITADILKTKQSFKFNVRAKNDLNLVGITAVVIEIPRDLVTDVIIPQFEHPIYNGILPRDGMLNLNKIIKITDETYSNNLKFTLDGGDSNMFEVKNQLNSNIVEISMKVYDESDIQGKTGLHFAIIAKLTDDIIVTTSVIIDITPVVTLTEPKFVQPLYIGQLNSDMVMSIGDPELTTDSYSVDISFEKSGDDSNLFKITESNGRFKIEPSAPLTLDNIRAKSNLRFTLTVTRGNGLSGSTAIVIDILNVAITTPLLPQFESPFYKGSVLTDFSLDLSEIKLKQTTYSTDITFSVTDSMFEIDLDNTNEHIVKIKKSITFDDMALKDKSFYSFAVVAKLGNLIEGTTTVILDIESPNDILVPQFEQSLYEGVLSAALIPTVTPTIKLTTGSYATDVVFTLEPDHDYNLFTLEYTNGENLVSILPNGLNDGNTKTRSFLKFVIIATKSNNLIGSTVVVIRNPNAVVENIIAPKFDKLIYTGSISSGLSFEMDDVIKITEETQMPNTVYNIEGGNGLFRVSATNGNLISIDLVRPLEQTDINDKKVLSFTIVAILPDLLQGTATVILDITSPNLILPPEFEQSLYFGTLSDTFKLDIMDLKLTIDSYSDDVNFEIEDGFDGKLFNIVRSQNNIKITTGVITDNDILLKSVLKFSIRATKPTNNFIGTTVVVIQIPSNTIDDWEIPEFTKSIYTGSLSTNLELQFTEIIQVIDIKYSTAVQFTLKDGESDLFELTEESTNKFRLQLKRTLLPSDIQNLKVLSFTVQASLGTFIHGTAAVIIDIETPVTVLIPVFEQSLYIGELDDQFNLDVIDIKLIASTYSDDVIFELVNDFDSTLFLIDNPTANENEVRVVTNGITEDIIKSKQVLTFVISATNLKGFVGTTVVLVNNPVNGVVIPQFEQSIYRTRVSDLELVNDIVVTITDATFTPGIVFDLIDGDHTFFTISNVNQNEATITLSTVLDETYLKTHIEISFVVEAKTSDGFRGTTTVIIDVNNVNIFSPPTFEQTLYLRSLDSDLELNLDISLMLTDETFSTDIVFDLTNAYDYQYFDIVRPVTGNKVDIIVKGLTNEIVKSKSVLKVVVIATNTQTNLEGTTLVLVEIEEENQGTIAPQFEESLYVVTLSNDFKIDNMDPIKIDINTLSSIIQITLDGPDANLFTYERAGNEITIKTKRDLIESDFDNKQVLSIIVEASLPTGEGSSTVVLFEIPFANCQIPNEETTPKFEWPLYSIAIKPEKTGPIVTVYAEVPIDPTIKVIYKLETDITELSSKITIDRETGEISLSDTVVSGIYDFNVMATNPNDNSIGYATVKLTVTLVIHCSNEPTTYYSLLVKHLAEETEHPEIFDAIVDVANCEFKILTVTPSSLTDIFEIKNEILQSKQFDRESDIFQGDAVPQIKLMLEIVCDTVVQPSLNSKYLSMSYNRTRAIRSTKADLDDNHYVYTSHIKREARMMTVAIIIEDINDNSPVFENPNGDTLIGYPVSELAEKLLPPYLIKVYATDKDEGLNAKILYTIDTNPHFYINGETGVVYPLKNAMDDTTEYNLVVKAIDQAGADRETSLNINVKRLEEKNFIVISIENEILDNLDKILNDIETEVGIKLNVLNAVIVSTPTEETESEVRSKRSVTPFADGDQTVLRIIGYAFNVDGVPLENDELETKISEVTTVDLITTLNLVDLIGDCDEDRCEECDEPIVCANDQDCDDECDYIGLIVGIVVVFLLLLIACAAIFVLWWKWIRPYRYVKRDSTTDQLDNDFNEAGYTEPVTAPTAPSSDMDIFGKSNFEIKNENTPADVLDAVPKESSPVALAKSLQSVLDMDGRKGSIMLDTDNMSGSSETDESSVQPPMERKKSIKFNETVERIDILDDIVDKEDTIL